MYLYFRYIFGKITDFGESRAEMIKTLAMTTTVSNRQRGTYPFMAPEVLNNESNKELDSLKQIDIWGLGMVLFCILNPDIPFPYHLEKIKGDCTDEETFKQIMKKCVNRNQIPPAGSEHYTYLAKDLKVIKNIMMDCLKRDPDSRKNIKEIKIR